MSGAMVDQHEALADTSGLNDSDLFDSHFTTKLSVT